MRNRAELTGLLRLRADEALSIAAWMLDLEERKKLIQIADEYDERAREAAGGEGTTLRLGMR